MTIETIPTTVPDLLGTAPADLIDLRTDFPVATRDVAVRRAERIRAGVASYAAMRQDIADAYAQHDWEALDYPSWHAYLEGEFGEELRALTRAERPAAVRDLAEQGLSNRAIGSALGVDHKTVAADLRSGGEFSPPEKVTGRDGKQHPATKPTKTRESAGKGEPSGEPAPGKVAGAAVEVAPAAAPEPLVPGAATHVTPVRQVPVEPERPKPPAWDPAERAAHETEVRRRQDIEAAHRYAKTLVPDVSAHILTIVAGYRLGEKHLVTREQIAELRRVVDLLEKEIDGEA